MLSKHSARDVAHSNGKLQLVSTKFPEDASKLCCVREEPCVVAQANTEIVVHRQWIRCPAGSPNVQNTGPENPQQKSQSWQQLRKHLTCGGVTLRRTLATNGFIRRPLLRFTTASGFSELTIGTNARSNYESAVCLFFQPQFT